MAAVPTTPPQSYENHPYFTQITITHHPTPTSPPTIPVVTLQRPDRLNAFTLRMADELQTAFTLFTADVRVRAIVLTGSGPRAFCAGVDLNSGILDDPVAKLPGTHRDEGGQVAMSIYKCHKPVIAAIQGSAVGIGITMTLPCTIRIARKGARIAFPFTQRGLIPEACSSWFLPKLIGHSRAMHILTTGETLPAQHKLLDGLFSEVIEGPPEKVLERGVQIAEGISGKTSLVSTYLTKVLMWRGPGTAEETHLLDSEIIYQMFAGVDKEEGLRSFLEKREPKFPGVVPRDLPKNLVPWWEEVDVAFPPKKIDSKL
ncbi:enoyl-CoA hydratase/carnithine racemase [Choiromyces venosus 120613-1]|uniref:Enoyl-CoA hydratase/carnithine racemase n=1 Tax=Choiromyces venosus 120613-1 TaxID=1336337 RepID=A0A3N4JYE2_9PEZI|nr:enoyl-CoA hydratase/carnithine racemase [Choiromyces venosus 120613-1]